MLLVLLFLVIPVFTIAGPAASCAGPSAADPCCNFNSQSYLANQNFANIAFLEADFSHCVICGESNAANTADAAQMQSAIDSIGSLYNQNQCWNGFIANSPGSHVEFLDQKEFVCKAKKSACSINFYVPYAYQCPTSHAKSFLLDRSVHLSVMSVLLVSGLFLLF